MMRIPRALFQRIARHAERTYPEECCGVLFGSDAGGERLVQAVQEIDNSQGANRERRFLISPEQYREAEQEAAARQMDLLGFYHSHPDHPARPSAFDTEHAFPWFTYLIVSVDKARAADAQAWLLREDRAHFVEQGVTVDVAVDPATTAT
jgi:proteasome lid subunit RPN8/RPN11